jgi:putative nucleotidyltransferase with HDIG domain
MDRSACLQLMEEYVSSISLRRHMLAVEAAMRAYAAKFGEDVELWGAVGLLHDFDYERWPEPPDHPLQGSQILKAAGYPQPLIYAILSHADYMQDQYPRRDRLDHTLYACDELCGFLMACAYVRPERLKGIAAKSVRKKMKTASFAAAINRDDLVNGAAELGVDFDEHVEFCARAMDSISENLFD